MPQIRESLRVGQVDCENSHSAHPAREEVSMKKSQLTEEQIAVALHQHEAGSPFLCGLHTRPPRSPWRGQRCIDNIVWDTVSAQHGKRPHQTGICEEVLSPAAAPTPWRLAIANAGLIESFMWDIASDTQTHRTPKPTSAQAIGLIVFNTPSKLYCMPPNSGYADRCLLLITSCKGVNDTYIGSSKF